MGNKILIAFLLLVIASLTLGSCGTVREIERLNRETYTLNEKLKTKVIVEKGKVTVLYRDREKIVEKIRWIPVEGKTTITEDKDGKTTVDFKWYGLCATPKGGFGADKHGPWPLLGLKLAYVDRFGFTLGLTPKNPFAGIDYQLPFLNNTSAGIGYTDSMLLYFVITF